MLHVVVAFPIGDPELEAKVRDVVAPGHGPAHRGSISEALATARSR